MKRQLQHKQMLIWIGQRFLFLFQHHQAKTKKHKFMMVTYLILELKWSQSWKFWLEKQLISRLLKFWKSKVCLFLLVGSMAELKAIKAQQESYEQKRAVELAETQRLEAAERRKADEAEKRRKQEVDRLKQEQELIKKVGAKTIANDFLANLETSVFARLQKEGIFEDPLHQQVRELYLPLLTEQVEANLQKQRESNDLIDAILGLLFIVSVYKIEFNLDQQQEGICNNLNAIADYHRKSNDAKRQQEAELESKSFSASEGEPQQVPSNDALVESQSTDE